MNDHPLKNSKKQTKNKNKTQLSFSPVRVIFINVKCARKPAHFAWLIGKVIHGYVQMGQMKIKLRHCHKPPPFLQYTTNKSSSVFSKGEKYAIKNAVFLI